MNHKVLKALLVTSLAALAAGCGKSAPDSQSEQSDQAQEQEANPPSIMQTITAGAAIKRASDEAAKVRADSEALKTMQPLSNEELKQIVPDQFDGRKRIKLSVGGGMIDSMQSIDAVFSDGTPGNELRITIIDGAGDFGSGLIALQRIAIAGNNETEDEHRHSRVIDLGSDRAMEEVSHSQGDTAVSVRLTTIVKNRFMLKVEATGTDPATLEQQIAQSSILNDLRKKG